MEANAFIELQWGLYYIGYVCGEVKVLSFRFNLSFLTCQMNSLGNVTHCVHTLHLSVHKLIKFTENKPITFIFV